MIEEKLISQVVELRIRLLLDSESRHACELCGRGVRNRWTVLITSSINGSSDPATITMRKQCCRRCAETALTQGHEVALESTGRILPFKLPEVA